MANDLSVEDKDFLAQCEEEFKDRFTELDEDYMKVFNAEQSKPPIMENWRPAQNRRFNNRRFHPYDSSNRNRNNHDRGYQDRGRNDYSRGYQDRSYEDRGYEDRRYGRGYSNSDNRNRDHYQPRRGRF
ncbi:RNA guanine-N7 methyltransferase activating subunit [Papilio machaon]|uniref:RNA guanine-N7 methyltransferase activating subunit n=1 Tax=Papilio machaon TaxID=76193 RepID=UPI001E664529|nr:RNA guanine-N7 methyltransferase activating subunit [Papilio machaon]